MSRFVSACFLAVVHSAITFAAPFDCLSMATLVLALVLALNSACARSGARSDALVPVSSACVSGAVVALPEATESKASLISIVISLVIAIYTLMLWKLGCLRCPGKAVANTKTKRTQSQTTYTFCNKNAVPQFKYLQQEFDHGAWSD